MSEKEKDVDMPITQRPVSTMDNIMGRKRLIREINRLERDKHQLSVQLQQIQSQLDSMSATLNDKLNAHLEEHLKSERETLSEKEAHLDEKTRTIRQELETEFARYKQVFEKDTLATKAKYERKRRAAEADIQKYQAAHRQLERDRSALDECWSACYTFKKHVARLAKIKDISRLRQFTVRFDARDTPHYSSTVKLKHINDTISRVMERDPHAILIRTDLKLDISVGRNRYYGDVYGTATFQTY